MTRPRSDARHRPDVPAVPPAFIAVLDWRDNTLVLYDVARARGAAAVPATEAALRREIAALRARGGLVVEVDHTGESETAAPREEAADDGLAPGA